LTSPLLPPIGCISLSLLSTLYREKHSERGERDPAMSLLLRGWFICMIGDHAMLCYAMGTRKVGLAR